MTTPYVAPPPPATLPPSPLDLGQAINTTASLYKERFGLFALIALIPGLATIVLVVLAALGLGASIIPLAARADRSGDPGAVLAPFIAQMMVLLLVLIAASALIQFKAQGMMIALARHTAEGRRPTFRQVLDSTRGLVRRALVLLLVGLAFLALLYLVMGVVAFAVIMAAAQANAGDSSSTAGLVFALLLLALPLSLIAGLYLSTRLYYVMPALTLEEASGLTPLSRSWSLTKGEFWRTLGWTLAAYILVALLSYAVNVVASLATGPMQVRLSTMDSEDPAAVLAVLIPAMIITSVGSALAQVLTVPALAIYQTVMFIDQIRRKQLPRYVPGRPYVPYGLATGYAPGPYQPAAQQYPPQQQHPQQPYSQPGYPPEQYPDGSQRCQQPPYPGPTAPQ